MEEGRDSNQEESRDGLEEHELKARPLQSLALVPFHHIPDHTSDPALEDLLVQHALLIKELGIGSRDCRTALAEEGLAP